MRKEQESFTLTKHAQDRLRERFPHVMKDIAFEQSAALRIRKMYELLWDSTVENRSINDTKFMQYVYEKYGFDKKFRFFANKEMLFIGVVSSVGNFIVTVVNRYNYISHHLRPAEKRFQKKPDTYHTPARMPRLKQSYEFRMKKNEHLEDHSPDF